MPYLPPQPKARLYRPLRHSRGLAGREEEHTPVRVGFGPHSHASALVRTLTDYSIPRPVQSIELDGPLLLSALQSSAGRLSVAVRGLGVKISGEYDVGGLGVSG